MSRAAPLRFVRVAEINEIRCAKKGSDSRGENGQHLEELVNTAINFRTRILHS